MKTSVNFSQFCDAFYNMGRADQFSYEAKRALFDFLEEVAPDTELDVIALCCEYAEISLDEVVNSYRIDVSEAEGDEEKAEIVQDYLNENTMIVHRFADDSFLFAQF